MNEPMEFNHFLVAQAPMYEQVLRELRAGLKTSHWMWFIFPQVRGLGRSSMSARYAIDSLAQARRYLAHELLGRRLEECTGLVLQLSGKTAEHIFGPIDSMKFHSSMTLFALSAPSAHVCSGALDKYFNGLRDGNTLALLGVEPGEHGRTSGPGS